MSRPLAPVPQPAHQKELQKVRDEMKQTRRLYLEGQITAQGFGDSYKPAEVRLNQLVAELPRLQPPG